MEPCSGSRGGYREGMPQAGGTTGESSPGCCRRVWQCVQGCFRECCEDPWDGILSPEERDRLLDSPSRRGGACCDVIASMGRGPLGRPLMSYSDRKSTPSPSTSSHLEQERQVQPMGSQTPPSEEAVVEAEKGRSSSSGSSRNSESKERQELRKGSPDAQLDTAAEVAELARRRRILQGLNLVEHPPEVIGLRSDRSKSAVAPMPQRPVLNGGQNKRTSQEDSLIMDWGLTSGRYPGAFRPYSATG